MRVLILNQFFYPDISATSQLMTDLAEDLSENGVQVTALCGRFRYLGDEELESREDYQGIKIVRVAATRFNRSNLVRRYLSYLSFYIAAGIKLLFLPRQDAIIALTTPPLIALIACLIRPIKRSKVVYLVQDLYPEVAV